MAAHIGIRLAKRLLSLAGGVLALSTPAGAGDCDVLTSAFLKGLYVPWHATTILKVIGKDTKTYEVINTPDRTYRRDPGGHWTAKGRDPGANETKIRRDWANSTCRDGGTEALGGEVARIVLHRTDTRFWISETSGLIVKTETVDRPATLTTTYTYDNVAPPSLE